MNEKDLLETIMKYQFYAVDLNLYLDNFPKNKDALEDFKVISTKLNNSIKDYEKNYNPLINFGISFNCDWESYINTPWPWENK